MWVGFCAHPPVVGWVCSPWFLSLWHQKSKGRGTAAGRVKVLFGCAPKEKWARVEGGKGLDLLGGRPTDCILAKRHFFDGQGGVI